MPLDSEIKELVEKYKVTLLDDDDQIIDIESQHSRRQLEPIEDGLYFWECVLMKVRNMS